MPVSVYIKIIEVFIIDNRNGLEIINKLQEIYNLKSLNHKHIYKTINLIRKSIAQYLKEIYQNKMCEDNESAYIAIDESLFCHTGSNENIWLIGLINTNTKYFRIEAVKERNADILEKIIRHHIGRGNTIITDGWPSYSWLNQNNSGYRHIVHIHGRRDFGFGEQSTSHVESIWSDIKRLFSKYYVTVKPNNFIYYLFC